MKIECGLSRTHVTKASTLIYWFLTLVNGLDGRQLTCNDCHASENQFEIVLIFFRYSLSNRHTVFILLLDGSPSFQNEPVFTIYSNMFGPNMFEYVVNA